MANFSAADVKKLRELTGAGMMDCKKALEETDGDLDKAIEALRVKGAAKAAKRGAEREATAGLVAHAPGVLVELNSETDFVAKNEDFIATAQKIADAASAAGAADLEALKKVDLDGQSVGDVVEGLAVSIGEKIELGRFVRFDGDVVAYMHKRAADLPPAVGVLVEYAGDAEAARGAAMQIAAMRPQYLTREEVPSEIVEKEREIAEQTSREEGKPEQAIAKITEGRRQRLLQGRRPAGAALGDREQEDRQGGPRRIRYDAHAVRPHRGRRLTEAPPSAPNTSRKEPHARLRASPAEALRRGVRGREGRRRPRRRPEGRPRDRRGRPAPAPRSPSSPAAATSSAAPSCSSAAWTACAPTTWACSASS